MKDVEKVIPEFEIRIGGETLTVKASYRTIFQFEKNTGRPLASLFHSEKMHFASIEVICEFIFAAIAHLDRRKFTRDWILENLEPNIIKSFTNDIFPAVINAAFVGKSESDESEDDQSKNLIPATESSSEKGPSNEAG